MDFGNECVSKWDKLRTKSDSLQSPTALNMPMGPTALNGATYRDKSVQEILDREDMETNAAMASRCCTGVFLPLIIAALVLGVVLGVILTSGPAPETKGVPRAALFIIEGFKGTTFNELLDGGRLPHIRQMLIEQHGVYSVCATPNDPRCAHAVYVEDDATGEHLVSSGAGIAAILTGVSPKCHCVRNDSWKSYSIFSETSAQFPSIALRVTRAGMRAVAIGNSHLLNGLDTKTGTCIGLGVLDAECNRLMSKSARDAGKLSSSFPPLSRIHETGRSAAPAQGTTLPGMSCIEKRSCNLFRRLLTFPGARDGMEEHRYTQLLTDLLGGLTENEQGVDVNEEDFSSGSDASLFIFHFSALSQHAGDSNMPNFTYESGSLEYAAQAFLIDSLIGQVLALVRGRVHPRRENWLVLGTSDHGGVGKSFGSFGDDDLVVPFFLATYTVEGRGYTQLSPLRRPVTHMDAAPTILKWLGVAPYDTNKLEEKDEENKETQMNWDESLCSNTRGSTSTRQTSPSFSGILLGGNPQGICGSGFRPLDCDVLDE